MSAYFFHMVYLTEDEVKNVIKKTFDDLETYLERVIEIELKKILSAKKKSAEQMNFI